MREKNSAESQDNVLLDLIHIALLNWKKQMYPRYREKTISGKGNIYLSFKRSKSGVCTLITNSYWSVYYIPIYKFKFESPISTLCTRADI